MRIKAMHLLIAALLCMMQMVETTTALQHSDNSIDSKFPQDVVNKIAKFMNSDQDKMEAVLNFLSNHERKIVKRCTQVLRSVMNNDKAFQGLVYKLADDINQLKKNSDYLIDMAENWNLHQNHKEDQNNSAELPQDIIDKIAQYLKHSPTEMVPIIIFFSKNEEKITKRYIQSLRTVFNNDEAFRGVVDNLVEDTKTIKDHPNYHNVMADIWNYYLKIGGDGQKKFEFKSLLSDKSFMKTSAAYNFIGTLSKLDPTIQDGVVQLAGRLAQAMPAQLSTVKFFNQNFDDLLQATNLVSLGKYVQVGLVVTSLTLETWENYNLWWRGEISGKRCLKNVIDSCASVAGGYYGGMAGAAVGTCISPGWGTVVGGVAGGIAGSLMMQSLSDWMTQKIFDLPKEVALENAYRFLQLTHNASNDEINSNYRHLAWEYHPKVSQSIKNWLKLQTCMEVIRASKSQDKRDF